MGAAGEAEAGCTFRQAGEPAVDAGTTTVDAGTTTTTTRAGAEAEDAITGAVSGDLRARSRSMQASRAGRSQRAPAHPAHPAHRTAAGGGGPPGRGGGGGRGGRGYSNQQQPQLPDDIQALTQLREHKAVRGANPPFHTCLAPVCDLQG
jgi:hypothetical protein